MRRFFHIACPVLAGACIYLLWRPDRLQLFSWLAALGLRDHVQKLRTVASPTRGVLPDWVVFSLPAALWMYSLVAALRVIWKGRPVRDQVPWLSLAFLLGPGAELAQRFGLISGRFDYLDCAAYLAGFCSALALTKERSHEPA